MNHSIFSDCKGSAFFKCDHLFSAEVIPVLFTDFRIFDFSKIGCGSEVELKNKFFVRTSLTFHYLCSREDRMRLGIAKSENFVFRLSLLSPFTIFAKISLMDNV